MPLLYLYHLTGQKKVFTWGKGDGRGRRGEGEGEGKGGGSEDK
jgi:hypothetical protein